MKPILEIQNVSKKFRINHEQQPYLSIRDSVANMFKSKNSKEDFWALKEVSFDVMPGDTVGIIGKNGAGKSTLLKILSKITPPTSGKIIGRGRIASLLEVGTGFHPELSGRENIFMNGSILGMRKSEILKNFDAIVDFAGVEKFIDTPLKHYSSGMQLRLAFAVAAFLENEILIIDEVLAVGDAEFQEKCIGKMGDISQSGRTILFVSHQIGVLNKLCKKAIIFEKGSMLLNTDIKAGTDYYLNNLSKLTDSIWEANPLDISGKEVSFRKISLLGLNGESKQSFGFNEDIFLEFEVNILNFVPNIKLSVTLTDKFQAYVFTSVVNLDEYFREGSEIIKLKMLIPKGIIAPNNYSFRYAIFNKLGKTFDLLENETKIKIIDTGSQMSEFEGIDYGSVIINTQWLKG